MQVLTSVVWDISVLVPGFWLNVMDDFALYVT